MHVEAPDEAGHLGNPDEKVKAIERVDEYVVGPLLEAVRCHDRWRIMIAPDHPTPCSTTAHDATPPPFCYAGTGIAANGGQGFSEKHARASGLFIDPGFGLIDGFMKQATVEKPG